MATVSVKCPRSLLGRHNDEDVRLTMDAAESVFVPLPRASVLRDIRLDSLAHGEGHLDRGALSRVWPARAGLSALRWNGPLDRHAKEALTRF